jgi:DNA-binding GntR family transcriptional regulator
LDRRVSLGEAVAERIQEAIFSGDLEPGQRLSDLHIAEELGTSRGSVREALRLLQAQGVVEQKPHRGTFVAAVSADGLRKVRELRVALETHAVRMLASRPGDSRLSALRALLAEMEKAAAEGSQLRVSQLDRDFHDLLCRLAGDQLVCEIYEREVLKTLNFFALDAEAYQPISAMGRELGPFLDAIEAGDGDLAAKRIEAHIRHGSDLLSHGFEHTQGTQTAAREPGEADRAAPAPETRPQRP